MIEGLRAARYPRILHDEQKLRPGVVSKVPGWRANEESNAIGVGAIQEWLSAYASGVKYAACPSREVIDNILDTQLDDRGKVIAVPGIDHGEYFRLWGRNLSRCVKRSNMAIPAMFVPPETKEQRMIRKIKGLENGQRRPSGVVLHQPKAPRW